MAVRSRTVEITGKNTYRNFQSLGVPFAAKGHTADGPRYLEQRILQDAQKYCITSSKSEPRKNTGTQTDWRDSETQTDPWKPPYKIVSGHKPEILTLTHLTWGHGLPAGVHEVHVINRIKMKRAWEAILPPMDTPANIKMRNSIITALEIDEWAFRESEIQYIMDLRLNLMRKLLQSRELECKRKAKGRFNRLQSKLGKRRDDQIKTIRFTLKRDLRKLRRRYRYSQQPCEPNIIERHVDRKLYTPQIRYDEYLQKRQEMLQKRFSGESCVEQEKDDWLPTIEKANALKSKSKPIDICIRESRWTEEKLKQLHSDLKAIRMNIKSEDAIPRLIKRDHKQPLPVTPCRSSIWNNKQEQWKESATFIQKFVKGRAIQSLMYEERDKYRGLIEELQSTQALEQQNEQKHREETLESQRLQSEQSAQEDRLCEIFNSLEGKTICGTLDFLSKELLRLEDERRAHAFALLAENERCMREAAEAGKRQLERNRRREFDEMFKQIVKVHQDSVETYLEDIMRESVDWISAKTAEEHVSQLYVDEVDDVSKDVLEEQDSVIKSAEEELIEDMINNFVLPQVEKHNAREKIRDRQQSYMRNAHISIYEKILELPSIKPLAANQKTCRNKNKQE